MVYLFQLVHLGIMSYHYVCSLMLKLPNKQSNCFGLSLGTHSSTMDIRFSQFQSICHTMSGFGHCRMDCGMPCMPNNEVL